jgi:hypothetical protein
MGGERSPSLISELATEVRELGLIPVELVDEAIRICWAASPLLAPDTGV